MVPFLQSQNCFLPHPQKLVISGHFGGPADQDHPVLVRAAGDVPVQNLLEGNQRASGPDRLCCRVRGRNQKVSIVCFEDAIRK